MCRADLAFLDAFKSLMPVYYSSRQCMHHYPHMAQGNVREYLKGERVWVKKYLYVLRPILACRWIEAGLDVVPMELAKLVNGVNVADDLSSAIHRLLTDKVAGREMDDGPRVPIFHEFFDREMPRLAAGVPMALVTRVTGHQTVHVVLKHYFRPGREDFRRAIESAMPKLLMEGGTTYEVDKGPGELLAEALKGLAGLPASAGKTGKGWT